MQLHRLLVLCGTVALAQLALADPAAPDAKALGISEAVLSYCARVVPSVAAKYQERVKRVAQGASAATLAKVRNSDEYRKAHASVDDFVGKVDEHNAKVVCSESVAQSK
jgi:hypothetical protein